jgi:hypothetical protein
MRLAEAAAVLSAVGKSTKEEVFVVPVSLFLSERGVLDVLASALMLDLTKPDVLRALALVAVRLVGRPRFVGAFLTSFLSLVARSPVGSVT